MEIIQKKRSRKGLNWEATFPDEPVGEKSRSFLQRVVFITASHILYTRGLLPVKCFKKRQIEKWKFYVVRAEAEGKDIVHGLKGVMEAIEFAYLRDFIIMVADRDREDEYEALEIHRITKGEKVAAIKYTGITQARKQFFHLIRRVTAYKNMMDPLPQNICTIFKLTYYDERTPSNYEPQGFIADEGLFHFPKEVEPLLTGRFDCEKHMITTSVHSIFMKSVTEMKSLMQADTNQFSNPVSRDTTICSSPTKTLRSFSTVDNEQQNDSIQSIELMTSSSFIDISGTLEITKICHTPSNTSESSISEDSKLSAGTNFYQSRTVPAGRTKFNGRKMDGDPHTIHVLTKRKPRKHDNSTYVVRILCELYFGIQCLRQHFKCSRLHM
ncbi:HORMA domain family protein [Brugia pahangi]